MIASWFRRRRAARLRIAAQARAMIEAHGDGAYSAATRLMADTAMAGDWDANARWTRVRTLIQRETGHPGYQGDTATRMLYRRAS